MVDEGIIRTKITLENLENGQIQTIGEVIEFILMVRYKDEKGECFTHSTPWFRLQSGHHLIGNGLELLQEIDAELLAEEEGYTDLPHQPIVSGHQRK